MRDYTPYSWRQIAGVLLKVQSECDLSVTVIMMLINNHEIC